MSDASMQKPEACIDLKLTIEESLFLKQILGKARFQALHDHQYELSRKITVLRDKCWSQHLNSL